MPWTDLHTEIQSEFQELTDRSLDLDLAYAKRAALIEYRRAERQAEYRLRPDYKVKNKGWQRDHYYRQKSRGIVRVRDPEKRCTYDKKYRETHKEKKRAYERAWKRKNKDKVNAKNRRYVAKNKVKVNAYRKKYREKNKERIAANAKKWRTKNKERHARNMREYRKAKNLREAEQGLLLRPLQLAEGA